MKHYVKEKWIKALRSGEYKQGKRLLCRFDEGGEACYCALGVLVEVVRGEDTWRARSDGILEMRDSSQTNYPSKRFLDSVGLNKDSAEWIARMNDGGSTFYELAATIENWIN